MALAFTAVWGTSLQSAAAEDSPRAHAASFALVDAAQWGTFNIGPARANVSRLFDEAARHDVLKLDYTVPQGTIAGLWAKAFPEQPSDVGQDVLRMGIKAAHEEQLRQVALAVEIKGSAGVQRIPVNLPRHGPAEEAVDWNAIGKLSEVVVAIRPIGTTPTTAGTLYLDLDFARPPLIEKLSALVSVRIAGVFMLSIFAAMLIIPLRAIGAGWRMDPSISLGCTPTSWMPLWAVAWFRAVKRDFVYGTAIVFIALVAVGIYHLGTKSRFEVGWIALEVGITGAVVAGWLKYGLTGIHLTAREAFRDTLASGLLVASASSLKLWQAPGQWSEVLMLSSFAAACAWLVYHAANAYRLGTSGRHLSALGGAMIVGTPYVVGLLLLLSPDSVLPALVRGLAGKAAMAAILFAFNEIVANGIALAVGHVSNVPGLRRLGLRPDRNRVWTESQPTCGGTLKTCPTLRAHLALLAVAVAAIAAPGVAGLGSGPWIASWPAIPRLIAAVLATVLSQAGLWAEVYLITGMAMDAIHGKSPSWTSAYLHPLEGFKKGAIFSGVFMAVVYGIQLLWASPLVGGLAEACPLVLGLLLGAAAFPLAKTAIETFDGSRGFFRRLAKSFGNPTLYARGAMVGAGLAYAMIHALASSAMATRVYFGLAVGVAALAGVNLLRDCAYALRGRGGVQSWRVYLMDALLGGFIGAAIGFYLDAAQVSVIVAKFHRYTSIGIAPEPFGVYPLLSKWGYINLGTVTGGASLLLAEALAGVISWSIPAWLFALNRTLMSAYFRKETGPIKALFTKAGLVELTQNMLEVLRWGLWMSPIINSFLRPMGNPTWYNQDGAVHTVAAIFHHATTSPDAFRAWSLQIFVYLLAYDWVRILIWLDHMGLRVATLVNLSFLGMDRLEERLARFLGRAATARCIPEGVKRFTTWAPLLIPFYIPRGKEWDFAWNQAEALQHAAHGGGIFAAFVSLPIAGQCLLVASAVVATSAACSSIRWLKRRANSRRGEQWSLGNSAYEVVLKDNGEVFSRTTRRGYDVSRRSYDLLDPAGRTLFVVETSPQASGPSLECGDLSPLSVRLGKAISRLSGELGHEATLAKTAESGDKSPHSKWPIFGNYPRGRFPASQFEGGEGSLTICNEHHGIKTTIEISLPADTDPAELWTVTLENLTARTRRLKLVPYLEWVLNRPEADRGHTQYNRLFAEMQYVGDLHGVLARDKHSKALGFLAADVPPEGFLTSRIDFIGRGRSLWTPRGLETLAFSAARDTDAHPTFDPIASMVLDVPLEARGTRQVRFLIGLTVNEREAIELIERHLRGARFQRARHVENVPHTTHRIGHGEIAPGIPQPYSTFSDDGRTLVVHTPLTPRPYDHTMANSRGHVMVVTNRGLQTSSSWNSQQNRLTPDWPDTVTREVPAEAFYLYDPDRRRWYSPTYHPLNDAGTAHEVEFSVDGSATYRMTQSDLSTELTVFVPPEDPAGVYLLTVKNHGDAPRRLRLAPYFQMVLADQPENSGPLAPRFDEALNAVFFENPRNRFRTGPAFVAVSYRPEQVETSRGRFFGADRDVARPYLVEFGKPDASETEDGRPIAALLTTLEIPAHGESTIAVLLGQADDRQQAAEVIQKYRDPQKAQAGLEATRRQWLSRMDTLRVETDDRALDRYLDWLKYQALAERIWARRGFYQASGAYGFRDQLQDAVNLMWMDPAVARRQILLHASQQFPEGDVVHWFHLLQDGRTGFAARTHASDNLLWLPWAVVEYIGATGDESVLEEQTPYLEAEQPFEPLPAGKHGMGFDPLRSSRTDCVYRHCLKAIDLVLEKRMGTHGLPLMGAGDWNDGLDEIGSQGRGESVWLGFFLDYILDRMAGIVERKDGPARQAYYLDRLRQLEDAIELTWRGDRYLRAIHDDGTEIGTKGSGIWEIDALTAAWAVMSGINPQRGRIVFDTALEVLEKENTVLLGWPPLREDTKPYLGRSSRYPEGVRENGMYCHGVQWLVGAARILAEACQRDGDLEKARQYRQTAKRLWLKISPIPHVAPGEIETYGGQPNKQAADMVTTFDPGRMIWHGYTGAAGWMFRQALEGVLGARLVRGEVILPADGGEGFRIRGFRVQDFGEKDVGRREDVGRTERSDARREDPGRSPRQIRRFAPSALRLLLALRG